MAYFVLMCYGHLISSPSLTLPTYTTLTLTLTITHVCSSICTLVRIKLITRANRHTATKHI